MVDFPGYNTLLLKETTTLNLEEITESSVVSLENNKIKISEVKNMSYSQLEIFNIMKRHKEDLRASIPADQRNPDIDRYNDQADDFIESLLIRKEAAAAAEREQSMKAAIEEN